MYMPPQFEENLGNGNSFRLYWTLPSSGGSTFHTSGAGSRSEVTLLLSGWLCQFHKSLSEDFVFESHSCLRQQNLQQICRMNPLLVVPVITVQKRDNLFLTDDRQ